MKRKQDNTLIAVGCWTAYSRTGELVVRNSLSQSFQLQLEVLIRGWIIIKENGQPEPIGNQFKNEWQGPFQHDEEKAESEDVSNAEEDPGNAYNHHSISIWELFHA